jgi:predicted alpha/beta-hydrolase family hydrolase
MKVVLGHGAGGSAASLKPYVDGLCRRGIAAVAVDLPRRGRFPVRAELAVEEFVQAAGAGTGLVVGGTSYGGRVASLAAAGRSFAGLVLFAYPLHPRGRRDAALRTAHWPRIRCPVLLLSGERDEHAELALLVESVKLLRRAELVTYPGIRHDLLPVLEDALDRAAAFVHRLKT